MPKKRSILKNSKKTITYITFVTEKTQKRFADTVLLRRVNCDHTSYREAESTSGKKFSGGTFEI